MANDLESLVVRVRELIDVVVTSQPSPEALSAAIAAVDGAVAALAAFVPTPRPPRYPQVEDAADPRALMPYDPIIGRLSPLMPPIEFTHENGKTSARVRYGAPYEGPPGCVHGGVIAAAFDQVFNVANLMVGAAGPTAELVFRYRRPTPLAADLVFEAWQDRTEGRRIHTRGRLRHGDEITVEAEGTFVLLPADEVMKLLERT